MERALRATWRRRGLAACALWPLAQLYGGVAGARRRRYASGRAGVTRLPLPVIVIGNVVAGGAGKTPTTLAVAQHLKEAGWRPGIVSRGYGRTSDATLEVRPDASPTQTGDEPLLLRRRLDVPVFVGRDRAEAGAALLAAHREVDVLVSDDGLQHLALARDIEICVFDARGIGNGWLLPAGPLRERWPRPVDLILVTEEPAPNLLLPPGAALFQASRDLGTHAIRADGSSTALESLKGTALTALAGIARPEAFFAMLRARGLALRQTIALPDHVDADVLEAALPADGPLICTEKDAPKVWPIRPEALAVPLILDVPADFFAAFDGLLAQIAAQRPGARRAGSSQSPSANGAA